MSRRPSTQPRQPLETLTCAQTPAVLSITTSTLPGIWPAGGCDGSGLFHADIPEGGTRCVGIHAGVAPHGAGGVAGAAGTGAGAEGAGAGTTGETAAASDAGTGAAGEGATGAGVG